MSIRKTKAQLEAELVNTQNRLSEQRAEVAAAKKQSCDAMLSDAIRKMSGHHILMRRERDMIIFEKGGVSVSMEMDLALKYGLDTIAGMFDDIKSFQPDKSATYTISLRNGGEWQTTRDTIAL